VTNASWGGLGAGNFVNSSSVSGGGAGGRTFVDTVVTDAMMQAGAVLAVKYRGQSISAASANGCRFCVYRKNGSNFDFVGASETFTMDVSGATVTKTLGTPITGVQVGDYCGIWMDNSPGTPDNELWVTAGGSMKYLDGAMPTGTNVAFPNALSFTLNLEFLGAQPVAAVTGDSIEAGSNGGATFVPFFGGGPSLGSDGWPPKNEIGYGMSQIIGGFSYQNFALGSTDLSWVNLTAMPAIMSGTGMHGSVACGATELYIHSAVNGISAGQSNSSMLSDLDGVRSQWGTALPMFVDEVLPWGNAGTSTDPKCAATRSWNSALAAWAVGKSNVVIVLCHDVFGAIKTSTGQLDLLKTLYDSGDGLHINTAGRDALATLRAASRASYFSGGAHPVAKITQPIAFGAMSMRRYGSFAGKAVPVITPDVRVTFRGGGRSVSYSGGGRKTTLGGGGGRG